MFHWRLERTIDCWEHRRKKRCGPCSLHGKTEKKKKNENWCTCRDKRDLNIWFYWEPIHIKVWAGGPISSGVKVVFHKCQSCCSMSNSLVCLFFFVFYTVTKSNLPKLGSNLRSWTLQIQFKTIETSISFLHITLQNYIGRLLRGFCLYWSHTNTAGFCWQEKWEIIDILSFF